VKLVFAFECFADEDIWHILVNECGLPLRKRHSESKGRVVTDTLRNFRAHLGLVDQDPGAVPPESLQQAKRVQFEGDVELRTLRDHYVLILRPRLEDCFMKGMRREVSGRNSRRLRKSCTVYWERQAPTVTIYFGRN